MFDEREFMGSKKDRFGETMSLVRRARENIYFAEKDRQLTERLRTRLPKTKRLEEKDPKSAGRPKDQGRGKNRTSGMRLAPRVTPQRLAPANVRKNAVSSKTYLVPVDFSAGSEIAIRHAAKIAWENQGKLLLLHVINWKTVSAPEFPRNHVKIFINKTRDGLEKLARRLRLEPGEYSSDVIWGGNTARTIADYAKEIRASMIIMGSHGRTGFKRLMLGSVAERTLRYAECPVLIVKK
jgi:nucleotide-binding universal stress UspA family protein